MPTSCTICYYGQTGVGSFGEATLQAVEPPQSKEYIADITAGILRVSPQEVVVIQASGNFRFRASKDGTDPGIPDSADFTFPGDGISTNPFIQMKNRAFRIIAV